MIRTKVNLGLGMIIVCGAFTAGCQAHIFSPPGRVNLMESSAALKEGQQAAAVVVGNSAAGFEAVALAATYKAGVSDEVELGVDGNYMILDDSEAAADLDPYIVGGRARVKWAPEGLGGYGALTAGLGAGYSIAGGYVSPDIGVVAAFENRYIVPFIGANAFISQPVGSKAVDISRNSEALGTRLEKPETTWGTQMDLGAKVPISLGESGALLNIYAGAHILYVNDGDEDKTTSGIMAGPEFVF